MRINEVLRRKQIDGVVTISPEATVRELLTALAEHNVGALVVSTDGATLTGIVSERDVVRTLASDEAALDAPISQIMTTAVHVCAPDQPLDDLMSVMTEHRVRHVPVVAHDQLAGIVSIGDVVKNRMAELEFERDQLDSYVQQS